MTLYRQVDECLVCGSVEDHSDRCFDRLPHQMYEKVEATDRICTTHGRCMWVNDVYACPGNAIDSDDVCRIYDVVRVKEDS